MTLPKTLTAVYQHVDGDWIAWVEELPGANTQAATLEEALENLREAVAMMLEDDDSPPRHAIEVNGGALHQTLTVCA